MRIIHVLSYATFVCLLLPASATAQPAPANGNATKVVRAVRVDAPPLIDGRLDEAVWGEADVITDFHQIRPGDGTGRPSAPRCTIACFASCESVDRDHGEE